ncbi:MAG: cyclic nucleotide-binding domain-containing protein, partial [Archangium sp.]|nr:cyclic nucleotide-binding domain-containing protein [Archangium sp.]
QFKPCTFGDGHLVISESHPVEAVHMLLRGVCAATHHSGERYPDLREGDLFGEISVLSDGVATASVRTVGPVLTMSLSAEAFKATVLSTPEAEQAVARVMKERLIRTSIFDQMSGLTPTGDTRV